MKDENGLQSLVLQLVELQVVVECLANDLSSWRAAHERLSRRFELVRDDLALSRRLVVSLLSVEQIELLAAEARAGVVDDWSGGERSSAFEVVGRAG